MATVDHLYSKYNPLRWIKPKPNETRRVLACSDCNQRRQQKETQSLSYDELLKRGYGYCLNPKGKTVAQ